MKKRVAVLMIAVMMVMSLNLGASAASFGEYYHIATVGGVDYYGMFEFGELLFYSKDGGVTKTMLYDYTYIGIGADQVSVEVYDISTSRVKLLYNSDALPNNLGMYIGSLNDELAEYARFNDKTFAYNTSRDTKAILFNPLEEEVAYVGYKDQDDTSYRYMTIKGSYPTMDEGYYIQDVYVDGTAYFIKNSEEVYDNTSVYYAGEAVMYKTDINDGLLTVQDEMSMPIPENTGVYNLTYLSPLVTPNEHEMISYQKVSSPGTYYVLDLNTEQVTTYDVSASLNLSVETFGDYFIYSYSNDQAVVRSIYTGKEIGTFETYDRIIGSAFGHNNVEYIMTYVDTGSMSYPGYIPFGDIAHKIGLYSEAGMVNIEFSGQYLALSGSTGLPFINSDNRTMIPLRLMSETVGASVKWNPDTQTIDLVRHGATVKVALGSKTVESSLYGTIEMDTEAVAINGRTYVPLRFVSEAFGLLVSYENVGGAHEISIEEDFGGR